MALDAGQVAAYITGISGLMVGVVGAVANRAGAGLTRQTGIEALFRGRLEEVEKQFAAQRTADAATIETLKAQIEENHAKIDLLRQERLELQAKVDRLELTSERLQEDYIDCQEALHKMETGQAIIQRRLEERKE